MRRSWRVRHPKLRPRMIPMKTPLLLASGVLAAAALIAGASSATAPAAGTARFSVTVTNLTRSQPLSPILAVTHDANTVLFTPGQAASTELAMLAEDGDNSALGALAGSLAGVQDVASGMAPIGPGGTDSVIVEASLDNRYLSVAGMLVNTNDAFMAVDSFRLGGGPMVVNAVAYDAGSEANSELCAYIPGPACNNPFQHDPAAPEGFVFISNGIQGIGDLAPELYDWRNPVARVEIRRLP